MAFKVTTEKWLAAEGDRIEAFVLMPKFWHKAWTRLDLRKELSDIGLDYSEREIAVLNDELHRRGIVEDTPEG